MGGIDKPQQNEQLIALELGLLSEWGLVEDENCRRDDGCPEATFVTHGGLSDVCRTNDLVREAVDLLLLVPGTVGVELNVQSGSEHLGSKFFRIFPGGVFGLTEGMMFAEIPVGIAIGGYCNPNRGCQQAMRFTSGVLGHDCKDDFSWMKVLYALFSR